MTLSLVLLGAAFAQAALAASSSNPNLVQLLGPQSVNLWKLGKQQNSQDTFVVQDATQVHMEAQHFHTRWFKQPLDLCQPSAFNFF